MPAKNFRKWWKSHKQITYQDAYNGPVKTLSSDLYFEAGSSRTAGSALPGYRKMLKAHLPCTTILSGERVTVKRVPLKGNVLNSFRNPAGVWIPTKQEFYGFPGQLAFVSLPTAPGTDFGEADAKAVRRYFKSVSEARQAMQGLVWIGELKKTIHGLRNPAQALFKAANNDYLAAVKRIKHRNPKGWVNGLTGAYLEWVYGVKPLLMDINDGYDALERLNDGPTASRPVKGAGKVYAVVSSKGSASFDAGRVSIVTYTDNISEKKVKYKGLYSRHRSQIENMDKLKQSAELFGFAFEQFIPAAWELLPWSFLVDYFSNIGDVLEFSFVHTEDVKWVNKTSISDSIRFTEGTVNWEQTRAMNTATLDMRFDGGSIQNDGILLVRRRTFARDATRPSVPTLEFELPTSPQKWLNMAALFANANSISPQNYSGPLRTYNLRGRR